LLYSSISIHVITEKLDTGLLTPSGISIRQFITSDISVFFLFTELQNLACL